MGIFQKRYPHRQELMDSRTSVELGAMFPAGAAFWGVSRRGEFEKGQEVIDGWQPRQNSHLWKFLLQERNSGDFLS